MSEFYTAQNMEAARRLADYFTSLQDGVGAFNVYTRPGGGKDTQADAHVGAFNGLSFPIVSAAKVGAGEIFRKSTDLSEDDRAELDRGDIIPTNTFETKFLDAVRSPKLAGKIIAFTSAGRKDDEGQFVRAAAEAAGHPIEWAVLLDNIPRGVAIERVLASQRGRADDDPEVQEHRQDEYERLTVPVVNQYEADGRLIRVDGMQEPHQVYRATLFSMLDRIDGKG